ncbi:hypothetical protein DFH09DRAFT_1413130 [Mycena vulgaris]|nr:hypothetical protein DFH09DRAFT_1413130 [Mycena vulgaris]
MIFASVSCRPSYSSRLTSSRDALRSGTRRCSFELSSRFAFVPLPFFRSFPIVSFILLSLDFLTLTFPTCLVFSLRGGLHSRLCFAPSFSLFALHLFTRYFPERRDMTSQEPPSSRLFSSFLSFLYRFSGVAGYSLAIAISARWATFLRRTCLLETVMILSMGRIYVRAVPFLFASAIPPPSMHPFRPASCHLCILRATTRLAFSLREAHGTVMILASISCRASHSLA